MFLLELYKLFKRKLVLIMLFGIIILVILGELFANGGWYYDEQQRSHLHYQLDLYETHKGFLTEKRIEEYKKFPDLGDDIEWIDFQDIDFDIYFGYYHLWNWYLNGSFVRCMKFLLIFVCVAFSMLFAYEKECGIWEVLLSTKNGRKKCTKAKILVAFFSTNILFLVMVIMAVLPMMIFTKGIGWDTSIQLWLHSKMNLNNAAVLLHAVFLSFLAINTALLITLFASFLAKSPMTAMCVSLGILLVLRPDMIMANMTENTLVGWGVSLLPMNVLNVSDLLRQTPFYWSGMEIHCLTVAEIGYSIFLTIGSIIFFQVLKRHQKYYAS